MIIRPRTLIGIDPASSGAAVVLRGTLVPSVVLWGKVTRKKRRVFKVQISHRNTDKVQEAICRTSAHVGQFINNLNCLTTVDAVAIEDCYLARNVRTTISLARFAGAVSAPLVLKCGFDPQYVKPTEWRKVVLSANPRTKREKAKEISLKYIPELVPEIKHHLNILGQHDHITDALGIAIWLSKYHP